MGLGNFVVFEKFNRAHQYQITLEIKLLPILISINYQHVKGEQDLRYSSKVWWRLESLNKNYYGIQVPS